MFSIFAFLLRGLKEVPLQACLFVASQHRKIEIKKTVYSVNVYNKRCLLKQFNISTYKNGIYSLNIANKQTNNCIDSII